MRRLALLAAAAAAAALTLTLAIPLEAQSHVILPSQPTGYVTDGAHLLSAEATDSVTNEISALRKSTGANLAVVTLPSTLDDNPMDVAMQIGRKWGVADTGSIGSVNRNLGSVLLVTPRTANDKIHCRIATARGAEGVLTDADAGSICRASMPYFQKGDYSTGISMAVKAIDAHLRKSGAVVAARTAAAPATPTTADALEVLGICTVAVLGLLLLFRWFNRDSKDVGSESDADLPTGMAGRQPGLTNRSTRNFSEPEITSAPIAASLLDDSSTTSRDDDTSSSGSDSFSSFDGGSGGDSGFSGGGGGADG